MFNIADSAKTIIFIIHIILMKLVTENKIFSIIGFNFDPIFNILSKSPNMCLNNLCSLHLTEFKKGYLTSGDFNVMVNSV